MLRMNNQQKVTPEYETLKVRPQTMALLREIKEATGTTLLHIIDRLAMVEVSRLRAEATVTFVPDADEEDGQRRRTVGGLRPRVVTSLHRKVE